MSQTLGYLPGQADASRVADTLIALVYALKHELRRTDAQGDLRRVLGGEHAEALRGNPQASTELLHQLRERIVGLEREGRISGTQYWTLDRQLDELGKSVGGCERIASTARSTASRPCSRPSEASTCGTVDCTPNEMRVTPASR